MGDTRITGGSTTPPSTTASGTTGTNGAQRAKDDTKTETTPPPITFVEKEGDGGAEEAKPDPSKPVLSEPEVIHDMSTDELNGLITDADKKIIEGDPGAVATADGGGSEQTLEEATAATYQRINNNAYLKDLGIQISEDGITIRDDETGEQRPLSESKVDPRLIQQMLLGILLQDLRDQRAEAAGERQKYLQGQVANNIMNSINEQIKAEKAKEGSADSGKAGEILGWIGAVLSFIRFSYSYDYSNYCSPNLWSRLFRDANQFSSNCKGYHRVNA
jgi:hypothetical protein